MHASSIPLDRLPLVAADAVRRLCDELTTILGGDLVAVWMYGGTTFVDRPLQPGDLDVCVVVANLTDAERHVRQWRDDPTSRPFRVFAAQNAIARDLGVNFDTQYLLVDEIGTGELPPNAFQVRRSVIGWSVERAHWLAGQYVHFLGARPEDLVVAPTRAELEFALDRETEHLERHVHEGDASDPYEATYAVWNGCRILYTLDTGSPVISKRSAGAWGLEHLPPEWEGAIHAAGRSYDGDATPEDNEVLRSNMAPFVEMVRRRLPPLETRDEEFVPRWS